MNANKYLRTPIRIEQLIQLSQDILDTFDLYVERDTESFDENTVVYLDDCVDVNDETDEEIYPDFACSLGLQWFFSGQVVWDIITNTQHQLKNATTDDYIKNFNYYNEYDCFFDF